MPEYEIIPFQGIGGARLGEPRHLLGQRLGEHTSFRRLPASNLTDFYADRGLFLSFDDDDRLEFIELSAPAVAVFRGVRLLGREYGTVLAELEDQGVTGVANDSGTSFPDCGFGLYTSAPDEPSEPVETVSLYPAKPTAGCGHDHG